MENKNGGNPYKWLWFRVFGAIKRQCELRRSDVEDAFQILSINPDNQAGLSVIWDVFVRPLELELQWTIRRLNFACSGCKQISKCSRKETWTETYNIRKLPENINNSSYKKQNRVSEKDDRVIVCETASPTKNKSYRIIRHISWPNDIENLAFTVATEALMEAIAVTFITDNAMKSLDEKMLQFVRMTANSIPDILKNQSRFCQGRIIKNYDKTILQLDDEEEEHLAAPAPFNDIMPDDSLEKYQFYYLEKFENQLTKRLKEHTVIARKLFKYEPEQVDTSKYALDFFIFLAISDDRKKYTSWVNQIIEQCCKNRGNFYRHRGCIREKFLKYCGEIVGYRQEVLV